VYGPWESQQDAVYTDFLFYERHCDRICFQEQTISRHTARSPHIGSEEEMLTLQHHPKLSLRKLLSGSSSVGTSATRSLGSSKICSSGPPSIGPSPFPSVPQKVSPKRCERPF
jgi:hypothetical protein